MRVGFGWLWASAGAANLGDGVSVVLLPLVAVGIGASPAQVALVAAATTAAWPVLGLLAGWFVDRVDRRRVLCTSNLTRMLLLAVGSIAALNDGLSVTVLAGIALAYGAAETLADTAIAGLVPAYSPAAQRTRANARIEGTVNVMNQLVGPPLAGTLVGLGVATAFTTASGLYLLAALAATALLLRRSRPAPRPTGGTTDQTLAGGLTFIWHCPVLRSLTGLTAAMNLVWGIFTGLFVVHALDPDGLNLSAGGYGLVLAAMAIGGVAASVATDAGRRRLGVRRLLFGDCVGTVLLVSPTALGLGPVPTVLGVLVAGSGAATWRILVATIRQAATPEHLLGRVYSASRVISWGTLPAGSLLAGATAAATDVPTSFAVASVAALVTCCWFVISTRHLDLEMASRPPDDS